MEHNGSFGLCSLPTFRPDNGMDRSMVNRLDGRTRLESAPTYRRHNGQGTQPRAPSMSLPDRTRKDGNAQSPAGLTEVSPNTFAYGRGEGHGRNYSPPTDPRLDYQLFPVPRSIQSTRNNSEVSGMTTASWTGWNRGSPMSSPARCARPDMEDGEAMRPVQAHWQQPKERAWEPVVQGSDREEQGFHSANKKRRASSPVHHYPLAPEPLRPRPENGLFTRGSPVPRIQVPQGPVTLSSTNGSSAWTGSHVGSSSSSSKFTAATSLSSFGRRSPHPFSPLPPFSPTETTAASPFPTPTSLGPSPRSSIGRGIPYTPHGPALPEHTLTLGGRSILNDGPWMGGPGVASQLKEPLMCKCCPKKPRKFDTEEELK
jgi:hypothetical protein